MQAAAPECIPYSRSAAALPPRSKQAPRKHLFHKISSLSLFDKKPTAEKWHKQIDETADGRRPISESNEDFYLFPWAQLRLHTDELLRKQNITDAKRDVLLCGLINGHEDKVIALAACAHVLSLQAVLDVLAAFSNRKDRVEDYLQAFVAAGHGNNQILSVDDEAWATTLLVVQKAISAAISSPAALEALYRRSVKTWLPSNQVLRSKVSEILAPFLHIVDKELRDWRDQQDWTSALPIREVLAKIDERSGGPAPFLEELLQSEIPDWRHWAAWRSDGSRLVAWLPMSKDWLRPLWTLLGPNFDFVDGVHVSMLSRIILDGRFVSWLEDHGITPGPGLLVNDTPDGMTAFAARLFDIVDIVCRDGGLAATFFWHLWLDDRLGLDQHTLKLWELAKKSLFERAPHFLSGVLQGGPGQGDPTSMIGLGLCALDNVIYKDLQVYLRNDIHHFIAESAPALKSTFLTDLQAENDWFASASSMVYFRSILAKFSWLGDLEIEDLHIKSDTIITIESLIVLQELHQVLQWPDDALETSTKAYVGKVVIGQALDGDDGLAVIEQLHLLWELPKLKAYRSAALVLARLCEIPASHRVQCLRDIHIFSEKQVKKLEDAMIGLKYKSEEMCHATVRLAAHAVRKSPTTKASWAAVTRYVLETYSISPRYVVAQRLMTHCSFKKYHRWVQNLHCVFGDLVEGITESMDWLEELVKFKDVVNAIEKRLGSRTVMHTILTSYASVFSVHIKQILKCIQREVDKNRLALMGRVVLFLTERSLAKQVSETLELLSSTSDVGFAQCRELVNLSDKESLYIAAVQMEVWMQNEEMSTDVKKALRQLGEALHLPASPQAATAKDYFLKRVAAMIQTAHQLESMRTYLKSSDRIGVASVLTNLGLEDSTSPLEEEIMDLPNELFNYVEQIDDHVVEMQFPLTKMKDLQRNAMGLKKNETLVVRLTTDEFGSRESFCVHAIDSDMDWQHMQHDPINVWQSRPPSRQTCKHNRHSRLGYVVMQCTWRKLKTTTPPASLSEVYRAIELAIKSFGNKCLVCDVSLGANLYRPVTCNKAACRSIYLFSDLHLRLADLQFNQTSVGLLMAAVQSAALAMSSGALSATIDLLPNRPDRLNDNRKLITMLDSVPSIQSMMANLHDFNTIRTKYSIRHELLFSWTLNTHQGFLVEATGALRIPNMPNVLQFVLADSSPEISAAFAKHDHIQPRHVLFHGTSMERLFAILCQGLKVLSETSLQVHGAVCGNGIYLAEEPSLAVSYSRATQRRSSTFSTQHADFVNKRVLLGIEYAGDDGKKGNDIFVAPDPTKVLLRYIFLLPPKFNAPLANHVVPAMESNFHTLKMGARGG